MRKWSKEQINWAKQRVTIYEVAARLLPGKKLGKSCHSPFRNDRNPSFSVYNKGQYFKDHATGEHGDVIDFTMLAARVSKAEAIDIVCSLAGLSPFGGHQPIIIKPPKRYPR